MQTPDTTTGPSNSPLIRIGGLSILAGMAIHIVLNMVIKEFPPDDATLEELQAYLLREEGSWATIHGFRYLAFLCIVLFAAGLFERVRSKDRANRQIGWGIVGLLGAGIFVTNGVITNGIETLGFLNTDPVAGNEDIFWMIFQLTRVLFTAELAAWSIMILGFSAAGWCSRSIPRWIAVLGFVQCIAGMVACCALVSVLNNGWAVIPIEIASITGLLWFVSSGVFVLIKGGS